jgi:hypothetical protein
VRLTSKQNKNYLKATMLKDGKDTKEKNKIEE